MQHTQLPVGHISFEALAKQRIEGTDTPFRDMLTNGFSFVGGVFEAGALTMGLVTNELFIEKQKSDAKMIRSAIGLDVEATHDILRRELENKALLQAMHAEPKSA